MLDTKINTIIFDFGGVLLGLDKPACLKAFKDLGCDEIEYYLDNCRQQGFFLDFEEGKISNEEFFAQLKKLIGNKATQKEIEHAYLQFLTDLPAYKLDLILKLHQKYKIILLSNINQFVFEYCRKKYFEQNGHSIDDFFDKVYLSYQLGICKPDEQIYRLMIADSNLVPEQCFYLDDGMANVEMGKKMGFQCYCPKINEDFRFLFE
ncbi:MAG: HAD family phosphatase [Bacteroidales bacterium]|nr:HAD family phosphatase [Bacteroidales bacterium]